MVGLLSVGAGHLKGMGLQELHGIEQGQMYIQSWRNVLTSQPDFLNTVNGF